MRTTKDNDTKFDVEFDSWDEFVDYAVSPCQMAPGERSSSNDEGREAFTGTVDMAQAVKLAKEGWEAGTQAIAKVSSALVDKVAYKIVRTDYVYDVADGFTFDVARVCANEPEHWVRTEEYEAVGKSTRFVRIQLNCCVSGAIDKSVITARGARVAALVELLEYAGCRCEVLVGAKTGHGTRNDGGTYAVARVLVKAFDQPLDVGRLAFALAHPSMLRRMMFGVWEHASEPIRRRLGITRGGGYGHVCEFEHEEDVIYLDGAVYGESEWTSEANAIEWCMKKLKEHGVEVRV